MRTTSITRETSRIAREGKVTSAFVIKVVQGRRSSEYTTLVYNVNGTRFVAEVSTEHGLKEGDHVDILYLEEDPTIIRTVRFARN